MSFAGRFWRGWAFGCGVGVCFGFVLFVCSFVFSFPAYNIVFVFHLKCSIERVDKNN